MTSINIQRNSIVTFLKNNRVAILIGVIGCIGLLYLMAKPTKPKSNDAASVRVGTGSTYGATRDEVTQRQAELIAMQNKQQEDTTGLNQGNAANLLATSAPEEAPEPTKPEPAVAPVQASPKAIDTSQQTRNTMLMMLAARSNAARVAVVDYAPPSSSDPIQSPNQVVSDTLPPGLAYGTPVAVSLITGASSDAPSDIAASISGTEYKLYGSARRGQVDDNVEIAFSLLESSSGVVAIKGTALDPETKTAGLQGNTIRHWIANTGTFVQNNVTGYLAGYRSAVRGSGYNAFDFLGSGTQAIQQTNPAGYRKPTITIPAGSVFYVVFTPQNAKPGAQTNVTRADDPTIPLVYNQ